ncbi:hypothetical protein TCAL_17166 [Tigriopus californicus]|uniref:Uncharacterized protein n=1 Tax=Tigriopus californicus TaxID=6832 RepID=A0A553N776_TIGCA|nr:uncharacterized protein LOC131884469 isoform X1 [Tigriopus californicus]TRY61292.1 hypothetical protein TCAL_17166 [Tigriopus californicus]
MFRAGKGIPGIVLFASWRASWTLLLWLFIFILIVLLLKCIKSFLLSLSDIFNPNALTEACEPRVGAHPSRVVHQPGLPTQTNRRVGTIPRPTQREAYDDLYSRPPRATYSVASETNRPNSRHLPYSISNNLNIPDNPPRYDQITSDQRNIAGPIPKSPETGEVEAPPTYESLFPGEDRSAASDLDPTKRTQAPT